MRKLVGHFRAKIVQLASEHKLEFNVRGEGLDGAYSCLRKGAGGSSADLRQLGRAAIDNVTSVWKNLGGSCSAAAAAHTAATLARAWMLVQADHNARPLTKAPAILGFDRAVLGAAEKKRRLAAWAAQRLILGRSSPATMREFLGRRDALSTLYTACHANLDLPQHERVLLEALQALLPDRTTPLLVRLYSQTLPLKCIESDRADAGSRLLALDATTSGLVATRSWVPSREQGEIYLALKWALRAVAQLRAADAKNILDGVRELAECAEFDKLRAASPGFASHFYNPAAVGGRASNDSIHFGNSVELRAVETLSGEDDREIKRRARSVDFQNTRECSKSDCERASDGQRASDDSIGLDKS